MGFNTEDPGHQGPAPGRPGRDNLAARLGALARELQHEEDTEAVLSGIVHAALELVPHAAHASVSLVTPHRTIESRAASSDLPRRVDALQSSTGQGPCLDASYDERIVRVPDLSTDERWPGNSRSASLARPWTPVTCLDNVMRQALIIASRIAETLARRRQEAQRQQEHLDSQAAHEAQKRLSAERSSALAVLAPVQKGQWWNKAQPADIATAHAVAEGWKDHDPAALEASAKIREEVLARYGIDTHDVGTDTAYLPLLEIVRTPKTGEDVLATAFVLAQALKKTGVLVQNSAAFVVNRILLRLMGEVTNAFDDGTPADVADTALRPMGLPMTPFTLLAMVGIPVAQHVTESLQAAFGDRFRVSANLQALIDNGITSLWVRNADGIESIPPSTLELLRFGNTPSTSNELLVRVQDALAPKRSASCLTKAWSPPRRRSTCA